MDIEDKLRQISERLDKMMQEVGRLVDNLEQLRRELERATGPPPEDE